MRPRVRAVGRLESFLASLGSSVTLWAAAVALAPPARADLCSDCEKPTASAVKEASGVAVSGEFRRYSVTGGACTSEMTGKPIRRERGKIPVWSAHGEAYTCPTGKATAHVSYSIGQDQRFDWSISATVGLEAGSALLGKVKAELSKQQGGSTGSSQLGTIQQDIEAAYCQRNEYWAIFFATEAEIELEFTVHRTWTWTVYDVAFLAGYLATVATGEIQTACGTGTVTANRLEPLFFSLGVFSRGCRDARLCQASVSIWQGWFPPLPPGIDPFGPDGPFGGQPDPSLPSAPEGPGAAPTSGGGATGTGGTEGGIPTLPEGETGGEPVTPTPVDPDSANPGADPAPASPGGVPVPSPTPTPTPTQPPAPQGTPAPTPPPPPSPPPPPPPPPPEEAPDEDPPPEEDDGPDEPPPEEPMS